MHRLPYNRKKYILYYSIEYVLNNVFKTSILITYQAGLRENELLVSRGIFDGNELRRRKLWESVKHAVNSGLKRGIS